MARSFFATVSPDLFVAFFEEINFVGVGGLYAELIRNRAFMDPATDASVLTSGVSPRPSLAPGRPRDNQMPRNPPGPRSFVSFGCQDNPN